MLRLNDPNFGINFLDKRSHTRLQIDLYLAAAHISMIVLASFKLSVVPDHIKEVLWEHIFMVSYLTARQSDSLFLLISRFQVFKVHKIKTFFDISVWITSHFFLLMDPLEVKYALLERDLM